MHNASWYVGELIVGALVLALALLYDHHTTQKRNKRWEAFRRKRDGK